MKIEYNKALWIVAVLALVLTMPALGLADFYSKGEPREAIVAYTMLEHGNWILPINNGGDIPYKPPFFHWCIALCSLLQGYVSEFTSRLPSAIALVLMAVGVATVVGILTALWSASSGMKALITGVNLAYDETETRKFFKLRGLALLLTLGAMVLMGVALATIIGYPPIADTLPTVLRWLVKNQKKPSRASRRIR